MKRTRLLLCTLVGVVYFGSLQAEPAPDAAGASPATPVDGVWIEQKASFTHLGFTSTYSCDGLADKLKRLLIVAGARPDVVANPVGCANGYGRPSKLARVDLKFYTLSPADLVPPGTPVAAGAGGVVPVPGYWKAVQFAGLSPRDFGAGDCELVEEFRDVLLPKFTTRSVESQLMCVPHQVSGGGLRLGFESFVAVPQAKNAAAPAKS